MDLENVMPSEISQSEKATNHTTSLGTLKLNLVNTNSSVVSGRGKGLGAEGA